MERLRTDYMGLSLWLAYEVGIEMASKRDPFAE